MVPPGRRAPSSRPVAPGRLQCQGLAYALPEPPGARGAQSNSERGKAASAGGASRPAGRILPARSVEPGPPLAGSDESLQLTEGGPAFRVAVCGGVHARATTTNRAGPPSRRSWFWMWMRGRYREAEPEIERVRPALTFAAPRHSWPVVSARRGLHVRSPAPGLRRAGERTCSLSADAHRDDRAGIPLGPRSMEER